jgi:hypothetical protein
MRLVAGAMYGAALMSGRRIGQTGFQTASSLWETRQMRQRVTVESCQV